MTVQQSKSPTELEFGPRRPEFDIDDLLASDWHGGSAFRTAWFNALSMLFPLGEKFFIESVVAFRDRIEDPRLLGEIASFQAQESVHRLKHQRYNERLCQLRGYDLPSFEGPLRKRMAWAYRELSARRRLAGTTANEHLTAIMADDMLRNRDCFVGVDSRIADLWRWHGVEETEHKSVAFDVHAAVGGTIGERRMALLLNTFYFFKDSFRITRAMLRHDGKLWSLRVWASGINYLFIKPGVLRRIARPYFRFFRKGFHPWEQDNRNLIAEWETQRQTDSRIAESP
ncbi:MAG: metal-dependent hydrolase [Gammaproteobacteria bacterium]|nr:metal-dependent hydrolase [Gammaproteobacteria bacterium]MDH5310678.1 metal-dependent hydrolase [Gammaproteobacteria bacterium]